MLIGNVFVHHRLYRRCENSILQSLVGKKKNRILEKFIKYNYIYIVLYTYLNLIWLGSRKYDV